MELRIDETRLVLSQGGLTRQNTDVIVNAATRRSSGEAEWMARFIGLEDR